MKRVYTGLLGIVLILAIWVAIALAWALTVAPDIATGTDDLGEPDLLRAACASITFDAKAQGVELTHCRQTAPPDLSPDGRMAVVHLSVNVVGYKRRGADVYLTKGLWHRDNLVLTS